MKEIAAAQVLAVFVLFCRVGSCLMVLPGFSSRHLSARLRLLIAFATTLALASALAAPLAAQMGGHAFSRSIELIVSEVLVGLMIGTAGRIFFLALEFAGAAMATLVGYGGPPGVPVDEQEPMAPLAAFLVAGATFLIFVGDLHHVMLRGLAASYRVIEVASLSFSADVAIRQIAAVAGQSFLLALQIGSPFFLYSIVVNLIFAVAGKLLPQVPLYFISIPFVLIGGLLLLVAALPGFMSIYLQAFSGWLERGAP